MENNHKNLAMNAHNKTSELSHQLETVGLDQLAFLSLCKIGVHPGEALLLTCETVNELLNRPWISTKSKDYFQHAQAAESQRRNYSAAGDPLGRKLNQLVEELAYFCFINALKQDVFDECGRVVQEVTNVARRTR